MEKFKALKDSSSTISFWGNKQPKCPHCGEAYDIDRNEAYKLYDDNNDHDVTCPHCDGDFRVHTIATYVFCTDEQDED